MKIEVTNFRGIKGRKELELSGVQFLRGMNGTGKSSLIAAIKFVVLGDKPADAICKGCKQATVALTINGHTIERILKSGVSAQTVKIDGTVTTVKSLKEQFSEWFGEDYEKLLNVTFNPSIIESMNVNAFTDLMLTMIPARIASKDLENGLKEEVSENTIMAILDKLPDKVSLEDITEIHDAYEAELKVAKKRVIELEAITKDIPENPAISFDDCEAELASIAAQEQDKNLYEKAVRDYEAAMKANKETALRIDKLKIQQSLLCKEKPVGDKNEIEAKVIKLRQQITETMATISVIRRNIQTNNRMLENLSSNRCPLSDKIICNTSKDEIKAEIMLVNEANEAELKKQEAIKDDIMVRGKAARQELDTFEAQLKKYEEYERIEREIKLLEGTIKELPAKPVKKDSPDYAVRKTELAAIKTAWQTIQTKNNRMTELTEARKSKDVLKEIVETLADKGIVKKIIVELAVEPINEILNETAKIYNPDYEVRIVNENGIRIFCKTGKDRPMLDISSLSEGERSIFTFFVIDMLNKVYGFDTILIIDSLLDRLDYENYNKFVGMVSKANYDSIVMAAASRR